MGCNSGSCPTEIAAEQEGSASERGARVVSDLAVEGRDQLREGDACCAFCATIVLDPMEPPASVRKMISTGRACPLSIVAYKAAYAAREGKAVAVEGNGDALPTLIIDGVEVDPLDQYRNDYCQGGSC